MKIIISLSKQVLFIHISQKCFAKFGNQNSLYLFILGSWLLVGEQTEGLSPLSHVTNKQQWT